MSKRFIQAFSVTAALRVMRLLIGLLLASLLARHLGNSGFGQLAIAMSSVAVLLCMGELGFARYSVRQLMASGRPESETLGITIAARLLVSCVLFLLLSAYLIFGSPAAALLLLIYGVQLLTNPSTELLAWFEAHRMVEKAATAQFIGFFASAVCIGAGIYWSAPLYFFAITYAVEGWTFLSLTAWWFYRAGGRVRFTKNSLARALPIIRQSWPELATQLALILLFRIDTIMVGALRGDADAGLYSASVRISELVYFVPTILASLCLPRLIDLHKRGSAEYRSRVTDYFSFSLIASLILAATLAASSPLVQWVFGPEFKGSTPILAIHAWSFIPYAIGVARTQYLTVENRLWVNLPSVVGALVINVALNAFWIPAYGGVGAAWATLVAYSIAWLASSFVLPGASHDLGKIIVEATLQLPRFTAQTVRQVFATVR